jgi:DNA-binding CsgD family transcriptional regulator
VFFEKRTGTNHFQVPAGPGGRLPVDRAAALLAMHCLVRGQSPSDYGIMVEAGNTLIDGLKSQAEALLKAGRLVSAPVSLSRRGQEVLRGVMQSLANKEIAAALNLSERTVKFHVSSLLAKFRVSNRMELAREARCAFLPALYAAGIVPASTSAIRAPALAGGARRPIHKGDVVSMHRRELTA